MHADVGFSSREASPVLYPREASAEGERLLAMDRQDQEVEPPARSLLAGPTDLSLDFYFQGVDRQDRAPDAPARGIKAPIPPLGRHASEFLGSGEYVYASVFRQMEHPRTPGNFLPGAAGSYLSNASSGTFPTFHGPPLTDALQDPAGEMSLGAIDRQEPVAPPRHTPTAPPGREYAQWGVSVEALSLGAIDRQDPSSPTALSLGAIDRQDRVPAARRGTDIAFAVPRRCDPNPET